MKKIITTTLILFMMLALFACGKKLPSEHKGKPIYELLDNGYELRQATVGGDGDNSFNGVFAKDDSYIKVDTELNDESKKEIQEAKTLEDIEIILCAIENINQEDVSNDFPKQEKLDVYKKKTIKDLINDGFIYSYCYEVDNELKLIFDNGNTTYLITLNKNIKKDEFDNLTDDQRNELVIKNIIVKGYSFNLFDDNLFSNEEVSEEVKNGLLYEYFVNGYRVQSIGHNDNKVVVLLINRNKAKYVYVKFNSDNEINEKISNTNKTDNSVVELAKLLCTTKPVIIKDITNELPSQDDLNKYINKTLQDLINDGFVINDHYAFEDTVTFFLSNGTYNITVTIDGELDDEKIDAMSQEDINALKIKYIYIASIDFDFEPK